MPSRRTALWSIYMGQMAVPGGLLGLIGIPFGLGTGLASIPGLILAIRIWRLGYAMLRRDPNAEYEARTLYGFAVVLNIVCVTAGGLLFLVWPNEGMFALWMTLIVYAAVSIAHAVALRRCADLLLVERRLDTRLAEVATVAQ